MKIKKNSWHYEFLMKHSDDKDFSSGNTFDYLSKLITIIFAEAFAITLFSFMLGFLVLAFIVLPMAQKMEINLKETSDLVAFSSTISGGFILLYLGKSLSKRFLIIKKLINSSNIIE